MLVSKISVQLLLVSGASVFCSDIVYRKATLGFNTSITANVRIADEASATPISTTLISSILPSSTPPSTTPLCCYLEARGIHRLNWYTSSVEHIAATVSTIVYQYDDAASTSYQTVLVNRTLPTTRLLSTDYPLPGVPTDIVRGETGAYVAYTQLLVGTAFTDPYGVVYASPTAVKYYTEPVTYYELAATATGTSLACPPPVGLTVGRNKTSLLPYPAGFFKVDPNPWVRDESMTSDEITELVPAELISWMGTHLPSDADPVWSNIAACTPGVGNGIPVAHIPVNYLTVRPTTTIRISSTLSPVAPTAIPITEPPAGPTPTLISPPTEPTLTPQPPTEPSQPPTEPTQPPVEPTQHPMEPSQPPTEPTQPPSEPIPSQPPMEPSQPPIEPSQPPAETTQPPMGPSQPPTEPIPSQPSPNPPVSPPSALPNPNTPSQPPAPPIATPITIGSSTLTPGGTLTIPGSGTNQPTTIILPPTGTGIVIIDGQISALPPSQNQETAASVPGPISIGSQTLTPNSASQYIIGSQTLTAGGTITLENSQTVILATGGAAVVVVSGTETRTQTLSHVFSTEISTSTRMQDTLAGGAKSTAAGGRGGTTPFEGAAGRMRTCGVALMVGGFLGLVVLL